MSEIEFPDWVKITACERRTNGHVHETPHGIVHEQWSSVTDYGSAMVLWRATRPEPDPADVLPRLSPRAIRRAARVALPASGRRRRVPGNVIPGRYRW